MATSFSSPKIQPTDDGAPTYLGSKLQFEIEATLLTGGIDRHYTFGLVKALASKGVSLDVIGSDELDGVEMHTTPKLNFLNLRGSKPETGIVGKLSGVLTYYTRLIKYAATAKPKVFHILWNNQFEFFDRTLLMIYYRLLGKRIVITAHNVNAGKRDSNDSLLNRLTLRVQYWCADHIFVHTKRMKCELLQDFGVSETRVSIIAHGINNSVSDTDLSPAEAKQRLGIKDGDRTILFFGSIRPYKGLEYLVDAFLRLTDSNPQYRLIIAGGRRKDGERYLDEIQLTIDRHPNRGQVLQKIQHIPDEEAEVHFKAADVLALPYTHIFQSGVLFVAYRFGLPVIATDVGSLREDIIEGTTGYLCKPRDPVSLATAIEEYFASDLFRALDQRRQEIRDWAEARHSWDRIGEVTRNVYAELSGIGK
jgi:D-inositol-3-phosphate glycosyltransferase